MTSPNSPQVVWLADSAEVADTLGEGVDLLEAKGLATRLHVTSLVEAVRKGLPTSCAAASLIVVAFNELTGLPAVVAAHTQAPVLALPIIFGDDLSPAANKLEATLATEDTAPVAVLPPNQPLIAAKFVLRLIAPEKSARLKQPTVVTEPAAYVVETVGREMKGDPVPVDQPDRPTNSNDANSKNNREDWDSSITQQLKEIEDLRNERKVQESLEAGVFTSSTKKASSMKGANGTSGNSATPNDSSSMNRDAKTTSGEKRAMVGSPAPIIVPIDFENPDPTSIERMHDTILDGGVIAFPTDTVYGLACDAGNKNAVERVYSIKGRDRSKPLVLMIDDKKTLKRIVRQIPDEALPLIEQYWPGALTLIFRRPKAFFRSITTDSTIGIRIPDNRLILDLLRALARPLAVTSANLSGEAPALDHQEVIDQLGGRVDMVVKGVCDPDARVSAVVDVSQTPFRLLRPGGVGLDELSAAVSCDIVEPSE